jgi:hypothetical protein
MDPVRLPKTGTSASMRVPLVVADALRLSADQMPGNCTR